MDHTITLIEFCENIQAALARVEAGEHLTLLRDGKPVARLEPAGTNGKLQAAGPSSDDPIFSLAALAEQWIEKPGDDSLTDRDIDRMVYDP